MSLKVTIQFGETRCGAVYRNSGKLSLSLSLSNKWSVFLVASPISEDLTWLGISNLFTWMKGSNESSPMNSYKEPCRRDKLRRCCVSILREAFTSLITAMPDFTSKLSSLHKYKSIHHDNHSTVNPTMSGRDATVPWGQSNETKQCWVLQFDRPSLSLKTACKSKLQKREAIGLLMFAQSTNGNHYMCIT